MRINSAQSHDRDIQFAPLIIETLGGWDKSAVFHLEKMSKQASFRSPKHSKSHVFQRLAILIHRANASSILARAPALPPPHILGYQLNQANLFLLYSEVLRDFILIIYYQIIFQSLVTNYSLTFTLFDLRAQRYNISLFQIILDYNQPFSLILKHCKIIIHCVHFEKIQKEI